MADDRPILRMNTATRLREGGARPDTRVIVILRGALVERNADLDGARPLHLFEILVGVWFCGARLPIE